MQKSEKTITFFIKIDKKSSTFNGKPAARMKKSQKSEKTIMFYMKNCKNDALLVKNLQRECFFDTRNPAEPFFGAGAPFETNMPLYYFLH